MFLVKGFDADVHMDGGGLWPARLRSSLRVQTNEEVIDMLASHSTQIRRVRFQCLLLARTGVKPAWTSAAGLVLALWSPFLGSGPAQAEVSQPSFVEVEPILRAHCQACHQPGEVAPMSLRTFEEVRPWARAIRRVVASGDMPPWFADPTVGEFRNDARLSDDEIETVIAWVEAGAPQGAPLPSGGAGAETPEWHIGSPDLVVEMPEPFLVPAQGSVEYVYLRMPTNLGEDRWIYALEVQPGARSVVHHIDLLVCPRGCEADADLAALEPGVATQLAGSPITEKPRPRSESSVDGDDLEFLASFLPGGRPLQLPPGAARRLAAGSELILNIHYTPNGAAVADQSRVGFVFGPKPERRVLSFFLDNWTLWIPAGQADYELTSSAWLAEDVELLGLTPHMHSRGKAATVVVQTPSEAPEPVLSVPRYDFNWQITYLFEEPKHLPAGTRIDTILSWDNSADNPHNPDPTRDVPWGRQTSDEMASVFVTLSVPPDTEPSEVFARR